MRLVMKLLFPLVMFDLHSQRVSCYEILSGQSSKEVDVLDHKT